LRQCRGLFIEFYLIHCACRDIFLEFGERVFGLPGADAAATEAYRIYLTDSPEEAALLFRSRVLAYSTAIWTQHGTHVKDFVAFCRRRDLSIFEITPSIVNLYLLHIAQKEKTYGTVCAIVDALSFVFRFYSATNHANHASVCETKKFLSKVCEHKQNKKSAFDSAAVRKLWNSMLSKYESIEKIPLPELRTFVLIVFQHSTFCRYSDVAKITLDDILFDTDYFKIKITSSKTDQGGKGDFVFLPKQKIGFVDAHMLLCLWLQKLDPPGTPKVYLFPPLA